MADEAPTSKACTKCGVVKLFSEFFNAKTTPDGLFTKCKDCVRATNKIWKATNKEKVKEIDKKSREKNKDILLRKLHIWRENNIDHVKRYTKQRRDNKRQLLLDRTKFWRKNNKEKIRTYRQNQKQLLTDSFVAATLKLSVSQATPEEIELKRFEITLKRGLKAFKQAQTQKGTKP